MARFHQSAAGSAVNEFADRRWTLHGKRRIFIVADAATDIPLVTITGSKRIAQAIIDAHNTTLGASAHNTPCLSENSYAYSPEHRHGKGWVLANNTPGISYLTIQRVDASDAFANDQEAAFHVLCAAAFDVGREGAECRNALREIIRFGQRGLNPIATMLPARQRAKTNAMKA
jgi:hypothetical protein